VERPSLEFTLRVNDQPTVIKMTYGLFNEIMQVVPSPENIGQLFITDAGLRDYVIRRMLTGNKRVMEEKDLVDPFEIDLDITELDDLVNWVGDHILYFFMSTAEKTAKLGKKYEATLTQLNQSNSGSESSASTTPSAGPSTVAKET
jgi:hypothetical protein